MRFHPPIRSLAARATVRRAPAPRSGRWDCATRGASRSTASPATSTSPTSARAHARKSISSPSARRVARNYGWRTLEGTICTPAFGSPCPPPPNYVPPIFDYDRTAGGSITGGFRYRGDRIPALAGAYVYGDFVSQRMWAATTNGLARGRRSSSCSSRPRGSRRSARTATASSISRTGQRHRVPDRAGGHRRRRPARLVGERLLRQRDDRIRDGRWRRGRRVQPR